MGITGYICKICGFKTTRKGCQVAKLEIESHLEETHKDINSKIENQEQKRSVEFKKAEKIIWRKYPLTLGDFIESIEAKPRKLWKCPDCGEEMSYHLKYYHQQNKDTLCKDIKKLIK